MKKMLKQFSLHIILACIAFTWLWFTYAALSQVNSWDPLTATAWNDMVDGINNFSFSGGNVGIGTNNPENVLQVVHDITPWTWENHFDVGSSWISLSSYYNPSIAGQARLSIFRYRWTRDNPQNAQSGDGLGTIMFGAMNQTTSPNWAYIDSHSETINTTNFSTNLAFGTRNLGEAQPQEKMRISANGNVGIGTESPEQKLHIQGRV